MSAVPRTPFLSRYPELGTSPIPVGPYLSNDYYEAEIEKIFKRDWLCVGRTE